jgi:hypothetical protein
MWAQLLDRLATVYDGERHHDLLSRLWRDEHWFDTPHQQAAARTLVAAMRSAGLADAAIEPFPADGRARFQDWTTKMAWECRSAQVVFDGEVIADRQQVPWASPMGSSPLPLTTAELVDIDRLTSIDRSTVGGKFVLGSQPPQTIKARVLAHGALAVMSDWIGKTTQATEHTTKWCNAWSSGPGAWFVHAGEQPMAGFCLTPAVGKRLRAALSARGRVELTAHSDSRVYADTSHCVTAVVPGRDPSKEIWLFGHANEPGANDNTSGVATLVEVATMLNKAIASGIVVKPQCSIRIIATEECLGMLAFVTLHPELAKRALCGINVDTVGDVAVPERPHGVFYGPFANPSLVWPVTALFGEILSAGSKGEWNLKQVYQMPSADDMIADPNCGIANAWVGRGNEGVGYHSSADTPEVCVPLPLRCNALMVAASAYVMASLDEQWNDDLLAAIDGWIERKMLPATTDDAKHLRRWAAGTMLRKAERWGVPSHAAEARAKKYCAPGSAPLPDLANTGNIYRRRTWGTGNFETVPAGIPRFSCWSGNVNGMLYWTDGKRGTVAVERLAAADLDQSVEDTVAYGGAAAVLDSCVAGGTAERIR